MKRFAVLLVALMALCAPAHAQFNGCPPGFCPPYAGAPPPPPCGGFQGAGDVIGSATVGLSIQAWKASLCGNRFANVCVSGTCADMLTSASTGLLVPQTINGTSCPAASTTTCVVNKWYDQTVSGGCTGSCDMVQTGTEQRGVLTTTCPSPLTVCIVFPTSTSTYLQMAGNLTTLAPFTVMGVTNYTANGNNTGVYVGFSNLSSLGHGGANQTAVTCNGTANHSYTSIADGTWFSQILQCASSTYNLFVNGASQGSQSYTPSSSPSQAYVGGIFASGPTIYEVEVGIWLSDVSTSASALSAGQRTRFGF